MLGKYTSLFDWKFGSLVADEPYLQISADITRSALNQCVKGMEQIAERTEEGAHLNGCARRIRLSHAAVRSIPSGFRLEHHLSHYWEMEFIRLGRSSLLHGAKVGAACVEISKLYHRLGEQGLELNRGASQGADDAALRITLHWNEIRSHIAQIPEPAELADMMRTVGGPAGVSELPIKSELLKRSLGEAHKVRNSRYTLLHAYNEQGYLFVH